MQIRIIDRYVDATCLAANLLGGLHLATALRIFIWEFEPGFILLAAYVGFPLIMSIAGVGALLLKRSKTPYCIAANIYWAQYSIGIFIGVGMKSSNFTFAVVMLTVATAYFCYLIFRRVIRQMRAK